MKGASWMVVYPWLRLLRLDLSLLLNMGWKAFKTGPLLSLPLIATMFIFMVIVIISDLSLIFRPGPPKSSLKPWMVKRQFYFAYGKKVLTSNPISCNIVHRG
jgi:hypothetical protein